MPGRRRCTKRRRTLPRSALVGLVLAGGLIAGGLIAGGAAAFAATAATTSVSTNLAGGPLSIAVAQQSLAYGFTLDGEDQSRADVVGLEPSDLTGTGDGWAVTVSSTPLENASGQAVPSTWALGLNGSSTSPSATTGLSASDDGSGTYTLPSANTATYPLAVPGVHGSTNPTPATVYTAAAGSGMGSFSVPAYLWLSAPANASSGTYSATLTWTISQGPSPAYTDAVEASSPAAFWQLDEASGTTAADSSGNGYAGTYEGSYTLAAATAPTGAHSVDLTGGYVSTPFALPSSVSAVTYEAWVNTTELNPGGNNGIVIVAPQGSVTLAMALGGPGPVAGGTTNLYGSGPIGGDLCFWYWDQPAGKMAEACSDSAVNNGHWHFVVTEYSGASGEFSLYVDGTQVSTWVPNGIGSGVAGPLSIPGQVQLGTSPDPSTMTGGTYTGDLADVAIYNTLLSPSQIQQQYAAA